MEPQTAQQGVVLRPVREDPWAPGFRLRGAALLVPCLAVLGVSFWLAPRKAGHGTHEELGLPPCAFLSRTGYPCPSCGLTTSFTAMAHGRVRDAMAAHAMGAVFFAAVVVMGLCGLGELAAGRDVLRFLRPGAWWAVVSVAGMLAGWGIKIALGLAAGTLPIR